MATIVDEATPPDRGPRYFIAQQNPWSRAVLVAGTAIIVAFMVGSLWVVSAHGWTQDCPEGATAAECAPTDPLTEGLLSDELGLVAWLTIAAGIIVGLAGFATYKRMPNRSAREAVIAGAVIGLQSAVMASGLIWFRGSDVDRFARNFLDFDLIGQFVGLPVSTLTGNIGSLIGWTVGSGAVAAAATWVVATVQRRVTRRAGRVSTRTILIAFATVAVITLFSRLATISDTRSLVRAAWNTLRLSLSGATLGFGLGLLLAVFTMSKRAVVRAPARLYINFFRGTPLIWQISFAGLGVVAGLRLSFFIKEDFLSPVLGTGAYRVAIFVLGLNLAAYSAEVYRSGIQSIEKGSDRGCEVARPVLFPVPSLRDPPPGRTSGHPAAPQRVRDLDQGHVAGVYPRADPRRERVAGFRPRHLLVDIRRNGISGVGRRLLDHHASDGEDRHHRGTAPA